MKPSNDRNVNEKQEGLKASWEEVADTNATPGEAAVLAGEEQSSNSEPGSVRQDVPSNYRNKGESYVDTTSFEVPQHPDRLTE
ncbi:hypothetical protein ACFFK0_24425 [Paenibacillus chartarius]|uniref:Uncharacterized protein n=1 Tax=Paenibacillus chartarius TaxID=747481 RepID=A0ABV6DSC7_9BACL